MPKISVIIALYNKEQYIEQCIESVLKQSLNDIEIIIVDDCSSDNSYNIVQEYAKKDNRIKCIRNDKNYNTGITRNRGIDAACGEYIYSLDADDFLYPNCLEKAYDIAHENDLDILIGNFIQINNNNTEEKYCSTLDGLNETSNMKFNYNALIDINECIINGAFKEYPWSLNRTLFKRNYISMYDIKNSSSGFAEDIIFSHKALFNAKRLMFTKEVFFYYRVNELSICNSTSMKYFDIFNVLHDFDDYFIQNDNIFNICKTNYEKYKFFILNLSYNHTPFEHKPKFLKILKSYLGITEFKKFIHQNKIKNHIISISKIRENRIKYIGLRLFNKHIKLRYTI